MAGGIRESLDSYILKALIGLAGGTGLFHFSTGEWAGKVLFASFEQSLGLQVLNRERISPELFSYWGGQIVYGSLAHEFGAMSLLVLAIVVALVLHVTYRATLDAEHPPRGGLLSIYGRVYFPLTALTFFALLSVYFCVRSTFWLVSLFLFIVIPTLTYAVLYERDLVTPKPLRRGTYLAILLIFFSSLLSLPPIFGERCFDVRLCMVNDASRAHLPHGDYRLLSVDENKNLFCLLTRHDQRPAIRFVVIPESVEVELGDNMVSLREWASAAPVPISAPADSESFLRGWEQLMSGQPKRPL
jgi:hypothetical protein